MSKIGNYNLILQEQAEELGFSTTQEAFDNGYEVVEKQNGEPYLTQILSAEEEQEQAHKAWLEERDSLLKEMRERVEAYKQHGYGYDMQLMEKAIQFIEKGEM